MERRKITQTRTATAKIKYSFIFQLLLFLILINILSCSGKIDYSQLPQPVFPKYPNIIKSYWRVWDLLGKQVHKGTKESGFQKQYIHCGEEEFIQQWQTLSTALYAVYGYNFFPVMESLDNFYIKQNADGFISRAYLESSGESQKIATRREPMIHPPLFTWVELKYFRLTGDSSRFSRVFPILEKYFNWLDENCHGQEKANSLYYSTPFSSQMINLPRNTSEYSGWLDMTSQMALFAKDMAYIAELLGRKSKAKYFESKFENIAESINGKMWQPDSNFYFDKTRQGDYSNIKTIAGFWPLLSTVATEIQEKELLSHLQDTSKFWRPHLFPTVAANEQEYSEEGFYWRGGVWGFTNYVVIKGLHEYGYLDIAHRAAWNHIKNISEVFSKTSFDTLLIDKKYHSNPSNRLWELYSPEKIVPGTHWNGRKYSRTGIIYSTGLGPVSLLFEDVFGLDINGIDDKITWHIRLFEKHGVKNIHFRDNTISLICKKRTKDVFPLEIQGNTDSPVNVDFQVENESFDYTFEQGPINLTIMKKDFILEDRTIN